MRLRIFFPPSLEATVAEEKYLERDELVFAGERYVCLCILKSFPQRKFPDFY